MLTELLYVSKAAWLHLHHRCLTSTGNVECWLFFWTNIYKTWLLYCCC